MSTTSEDKDWKTLKKYELLKRDEDERYNDDELMIIYKQLVK